MRKLKCGVPVLWYHPPVRKLVIYSLLAIATAGWLVIFIFPAWPLNALLAVALTAGSYLSLSIALRLLWPDPSPYPACPNCRYNLTGNTSGVCPECGKPFKWA